MVYTAATVWLMVIVLLAWGVHHLWSSMIRPRTVNIVLLPGTLVAQIGRIVGLLLTGAKINNTALMEDDEKGEPATDTDYAPKIPVFGPVIVGSLPLLATGTAVYYLLTTLGRPLVTVIPHDLIAPELPTALAAFWDQLRAMMTLTEGTLDAVLHSEMAPWRILLLVYLMICLTVRMAPFPRNVRGHVGAIVAIGVILALVGTISPKPTAIIEQAWPLVSLTLGCLLLLLMISLIARGVVTTIRMVADLK
ncbi:MAG: hypothetical protein ACE5EQ_05345 [Phycisphaerae bacterium]